MPSCSTSPAMPSPLSSSDPITSVTHISRMQQARLQELKGHQETLTAEEHTELDGLIAAAFDATVARTQGLWATPARLQDEH